MSTVTHLPNVVYADQLSTRRRTITTERHELFLVVGAALGRVPRPATGLLAGEHHEGRDDATRRAGPAGLIFCCGSSAFHHDSGRLSNRPTAVPLHGLGLAGQPRARRSEQNGGVLGAACGAIMFRTPPIRSGRGNDLAGAASREAVEGNRPEGVAGGERAGGWGSVARLISWPTKTDAGIGHAGAGRREQRSLADGSRGLKYRDGSPEGSVGAANILRGTGGSCFFGTCS